MARHQPQNHFSENLEALTEHFARRRRIYVPLLSVLAIFVAVPMLIFFMLPTILALLAPPLDMSKDLYAVNRPVAFTFLDANGNEVGHRGAIVGERLTLEEMPAYLSRRLHRDGRPQFLLASRASIRAGCLRAIWTNYRAGHVVAGGSTITQQTAKIVFLTPAAHAQPQDRRADGRGGAAKIRCPRSRSSNSISTASIWARAPMASTARRMSISENPRRS